MCPLHLEWSVCSPSFLKTLFRHRCNIGYNQGSPVAELLAHYVSQGVHFSLYTPEQ